MPDSIGGEAAVEVLEATPEEAPAAAPVEPDVASMADLEGGDDGPFDLDAPLEVEPEGDSDTNDEAPTDEGEAETEADEDEDPTEVEMVEFDFGGNKLEVPKGDIPEDLAAKVQEFTKETYADYQRKSQANADTAKTLAAERESVGKLTALNGEVLKSYTDGLHLRTEIEQLSQYDLNAMWQSNPDDARRISDALSSKQAQFQSIVAIVGQQEQFIDDAQKAELSRRVEEGTAVLDKQFKGFSTEKAPELVKHVVEAYGMPQAEAEQWAVNPTMTTMAYKAMLYDRMQAKAAKPQAKPVQAKPVKGIKGGKGSSGGSNDPDRMSMAQLSKHLELAS